MNLEEKIRQYFKHRIKPISIKELLKNLSLSKDQMSQLEDLLYMMEKKGEIYCDEYGEYQHVPKEFYLKHGQIRVSKENNYYIDLGKGNRIIISRKYLQDAKKDDYVFVEPIITDRKKHKKIQIGKIIRIVKKQEPSVESFFIKRKVFKETKTGNYYILVDHNKRLIIPKDEIRGIYPGDEVNFQVTKEKNSHQLHTVEVVKRAKKEHLFTFQNGSWHPVGTVDFDVKVKDNRKIYEENACVKAKILHSEDGSYQIEIIEDLGKLTMTSKIEKLAIEWGFTKEIGKKAADEIKQIQKLEPTWAGRKDLRDLMTFTIDPTNAKDLDDAISLEKVGDIYRLYVHIADIAHYVKFGSALCVEGLTKATSCYPSNQVIPQFPSYLSNELCSLKGGVPRPVKTFQTDMDEKGNIIDFNIYNSVIQSDYKMSYDKVNDILIEGKIEKEYEPFVSKLKEMASFSDILQQRRMNRGFLCFSIIEKQFEVDNFGNATAIFDYKSGPAQLMIENFMLLTNEMATNYAYYLDIPFVYRNHDSPTAEQMQRAIKKFKLYSHEARRLSKMTTPKLLQSFMLSLCRDKSQVELNYISEMFLSSMSKAYYSEKNEGHYGLALDAYATVTSPIRKGSDYLNHVILTEVLEHGTETPFLNHIRNRLKDISAHLTQKQWDAKEFEYEVDFMLLSDYAKQYINRKQEASITFLLENEMLIKTDDNIDGRIILSDCFYYDKVNQMMIDKRVGKTYAINDRIITTMTDIDTKQKQLLFELNSKIPQKTMEKKKENKK